MNTKGVEHGVSMAVDCFLGTGLVTQFLIPIIDDQCCMISFVMNGPSTFVVIASCGDDDQCRADFEMSTAVNRNDLTEQLLALVWELYANSCEYSIIINNPDILG